MVVLCHNYTILYERTSMVTCNTVDRCKIPVCTGRMLVVPTCKPAQLLPPCLILRLLVVCADLKRTVNIQASNDPYSTSRVGAFLGSSTVP